MSHLEKDFLHYLKVKEILTGEKIIQHGGKIEKVKIGSHNIEYDINSFGKPPTYFYAIATKKGNDKQPCFAIHIIPGDDSSLLTLNRGSNCFEDDHDQSSDIVLAALEIAKLKGASVAGPKTFEFTDNSNKTIEGRKIKLSELSFITTGKTWYERILPIKPRDEDDKRTVEIWREKVKNNKWSDIYKNLLKQGINAELDTNNINIDKAGSAMKVLERAKNSKKYHLFFNECMEQILIASIYPKLIDDPSIVGGLGKNIIPRLHGKPWKMDI